MEVSRVGIVHVGEAEGRSRVDEAGRVSGIFASWNQGAAWLRQIEGLRKVA